MRNIIEYLWQTEHDLPIFNTLIQSPYHPPHLYFHSTKQHRVLRKKESRDAISYLDEHNPPHTRSLLLRFIHRSTIELTLLFSHSALIQAALKSKTDQAIVIVSREIQQLELIEVNIYKGRVSRASRFMQWGRTACNIDRKSQLTVTSSLEQYCHYISTFLTHLCSSSPLLVSLILFQAPEQFVLVWANTVQTLPPTFFDFDYALSIVADMHKTEEKDEEINDMDEMKVQECLGCGKMAILQKEVSGEEVVCLRRKKGLPIRHILEESYLICQLCFKE